MSKAKILVVDDSPTIREYVRDLLEGKNYEVITAENGLEAVNRVFNEQPHLIVSDVQMPKMTGYQLSRYLKADEDMKNIPIIMLTSEEEQRDRFWGLKSGADLYLTKRFDVNVLIDSIEKLLSDSKIVSRPPVIKKEQDTTENIISNVNTLLDSQLLESTIINEITELANSIRDLDETIKASLELLGEIFDFALAGILMKGEENSLNLIVKDRIEVELVDSFKQNIMLEISSDKETNEKYVKTKFKIYNKENIIFDTDEETPKGNKKRLGTFYLKPLKIKNEAIGFLALGSLHQEAYLEESAYLFDIVVRYLSIILDNALLHKETQALAITDGLTRVYNHRYFQTQLKFELTRANRYKRPLALIMIDVDYFKHYNDTHGHQAGDVVLQEVAKLIKFNIRDCDMVARYGGEEFVIILPETDMESLIRISDRLRSIIEETRFYKEETQPNGKLTISGGGACFPDDGVSNEDLVRVADQRLYCAKKAGRNRIIVNNPNDEEKE